MSVRKVAIAAILLTIILLGLNTYVPARARQMPPGFVLPENFRGFGGPYMEVHAEVQAGWPRRPMEDGWWGFTEYLWVILADYDGPGYRTRTRYMEAIHVAYVWVDKAGAHLLVFGWKYDPQSGSFMPDRDIIFRDSGYLKVRPLRRFADLEKARTSIRGIDENSRTRFRNYMICASGPLIYRISLSLWMRGQVYDYDPVLGRWVPTGETETIRVRIRGFDRYGGNQFGDWYVEGWAYHYMPEG